MVTAIAKSIASLETEIASRAHHPVDSQETHEGYLTEVYTHGHQAESGKQIATFPKDDDKNAENYNRSNHPKSLPPT